MDENSIEVSIRRTTALLLVPLSALVVEFGIHLREQHGIVDGWKSQLIVTSQAISGLLVVGAIGYLAVSGVRSLVAAANRSS